MARILCLVGMSSIDVGCISNDYSLLHHRPQPRSFLRRLSTRVGSSFDHSAEKEERYKAVKMPRRDYKRYFRRDKDGGYAGTEPERDWDEDDISKEFGIYQDLPLHTILC